MELILFAVEAVIFIILVLFLLALIDGNVEREEDEKLYETSEKNWKDDNKNVRYNVKDMNK